MQLVVNVVVVEELEYSLGVGTVIGVIVKQDVLLPGLQPLVPLGGQVVGIAWLIDGVDIGPGVIDEFIEFVPELFATVAVVAHDAAGPDVVVVLLRDEPPFVEVLILVHRPGVNYSGLIALPVIGAPVPNCDAFQPYYVLVLLRFLIVVQDSLCQQGDVDPCVTLPCDEEVIARQGREF